MNTFDDWYAEHNRRLLAKATAMLRDVQTAADCVATTFMKAWQARERYDGRPVGPWLTVILKRVVIDHVRRAKMPNLPDHCEPEARSEPAPDTEGLRVAMRALPNKLAEVIRLVYLEDRSFPEAARMLGCSASGVHSRSQKAIKLLRRAMAA